MDTLWLRNYGARDIEKGDIVAITQRGVRWLAKVPPRTYGIAGERIPRGERGPVMVAAFAFVR